MLTEMRNGQQNRLVVWAAGQALFNNTFVTAIIMLWFRMDEVTIKSFSYSRVQFELK